MAVLKLPVFDSLAAIGRFLPGTLVANRYRVQNSIGSGGMSSVWLAHDEALDCPCALKFLDENLASSPKAVARFRREARLAARLRGTDIANVFDFGDWDGLPFIAMEYLEGQTLSALLERRGRLAPRLVFARRARLRVFNGRAPVRLPFDERAVKPRDLRSASAVRGAATRVASESRSVVAASSRSRSVVSFPVCRAAGPSTRTGAASCLTGQTAARGSAPARSR